MTDTYDREADSIGSYDEAILGLRCKHLADKLEIAVKALQDIKTAAEGGSYYVAYAIAREALIALGDPPPAKPY